MKRESEAALRRLTVVLKDANDAITIQDLKGNIEAWNKGAQNLYGYTECESACNNDPLLKQIGVQN